MITIIRGKCLNSVRQARADSPFQHFTLDDAATLGFAVGDPSGFIRNLTVVADAGRIIPETRSYA